MFKFYWLNILILILVLWSNPSYAQNDLSIQATVQGNGHLIDFAEVVLVDANSQSTLAYTTVENGIFTFQNLSPDAYIIKIYAIAYLDYEQQIQLSQRKKLDIQLLPDTNTQLDEVVVTAKKKIYTNKNGNLTVNIENSILATLANPIELLSTLPNIQFNADKTAISIIGKGTALIYIDNQTSSLDQLNSIPVDAIKDIEIIQNPSAKYEAEGRAVILVRLKQKRADGYQVSISELTSLKEGFNNYLTLASSFKKNKLDITGSIAYHQLQPWEQVVNSFNLLNQSLNSNYTATVFGNRSVYNLTGGLSYHIDKDHFFSFNIRSKLRDGYGDVINHSFLKEALATTNVKTLTRLDDIRSLINLNFNYNKKWKSNQIFIGGQSILYNHMANSFIQENTNNTSLQDIQKRDQEFNINLYSGRMDFEKNIHLWKWETGILASLSTANTSLDIQDLTDGVYTTNDYLFEEQLYAGYSQISGKINSSHLMLGIRLEKLEVNSPQVNRNQTLFFPKFKLNIPIDSTQNIVLNYGRSIKRPRFSKLSQISFYVNPFTIISENASLNATLIDDISASYQHNNISLTFSYIYKDKPVFFNTSYNEDSGLYVLSPQNFDKEVGFNIRLDAPLEYKSWSCVNSLSLISNQIKDDKAVLQDSTPYLYFYTNQQLKLPKHLSLSLATWGMSKRKEGIFERNALLAINFIISKTIFDKLNCSLSFNDIFNGINYEEQSTFNDIESITNFNVDSRAVALSLKYTIGNHKSTYKNRKIYEDENRVN